MEAQFRTRDGKLFIKFEAPDMKSLFEALARNQEIFDVDPTCGLCKSKEVHYRVRDVKGDKYYELRCLACSAQFAFGQHKIGGTLYPKRKDDEGNWLPNGGWFKWEGK